MLLRRSAPTTLVEQIVADVFVLPGVTDITTGMTARFLSRIPLAQRVS
jgi:hypothetical protein